MAKDTTRIQRRRSVTRRLEGFFTVWLTQLSAGTARIWGRVEARVAGSGERPDDATRQPGPPVMRVPMQQQPVQQQQQKKEED